VVICVLLSVHLIEISMWYLYNLHLNKGSTVIIEQFKQYEIINIVIIYHYLHILIVEQNKF